MRCVDRAGRAGFYRRGLAMIEVLVALALLGGIVAAAVTARGRLARADAGFVDRTRAVAAADELLTRWWALDDEPAHRSLPRRGGGPVPGRPGLRWEMRSLPMQMTARGVRPAVATAGRRGPRSLDHLRLTIRRAQSPGRPLYAVELLLPAVRSGGRGG